ncbi:MAG: proton-conducting transporter membrane subunit, partial [Pseudomonadota bacterium]
LIVAALLLATTFGSSDIGTILDMARTVGADAVPSGVPIAVLLIAVAALLKSAQFPTHGWLPEVMETPTPVSALLHAGIINAGGFLVIRFADVMLLAAPAMHLLAIVGGFTALFGAVVMLTQTSVKLSLAWSTVAQMGFMLLQCGLGAFALAVLHIVAHSLYKAHAFLSSGSVVEIARSSWVPDMTARPGPRQLLLSLGLALGLYVGLGWVFGLAHTHSVVMLVLGSILIMGVALLLAQSMAGRSNADGVGRTIAAAVLVTSLYFVLQGGVVAFMSPLLPLPGQPGAVDIMIMALVVVSFAVVTILQILAPAWSGKSAWQAARVHIANGFYANALFNRFVGALVRPAGNLS